MESRNFTSEKKTEPYLKREIERAGGMCIKLWALSMAGVPDRLCLLPGGRMFFAETKSAGDAPTPIQRAFHRRLRKLGFRVYVPASREEVNALMASEIGRP